MTSTHVGRGTMRALIWVAVALGANGAAVADDDGETPSAEELLAQAQSLAEQGQHADALRTLMTMLEAYPDGLDHDAYDRMRRASAEWFSRVPSADRAGLLAEYEGPSGTSSGSRNIPLGKSFGWLTALLPTTTVRTPDGMLVVAGWHRQLGNYFRMVLYATSAYEGAPRSVAGEHAIPVLMMWQFYGADKEGMAQTARVATRIDPDGWPAPWAVARMVVHYCGTGQVDKAKAFLDEIRATAGGAAPANVAGQLRTLIIDLEAAQYPRALDRVWQLGEYLFDETPGQHVLRMICMGIEWHQRHSDALTRERIGRLTQAAEQEARQAGDSRRRAAAWVLLGYCAERQEDVASARDCFQRAADSGYWAAQELARTALGGLYYTSDPERARGHLESFFERHGATATGHEGLLTMLGDIHRRQGRYEEALELFQEVDRRSQTGVAMRDARGRALTAGMVGCLRGLGRQAEADAMAAPILVELGYGTPIEQLSGENVGTLYPLLKKMGLPGEAERFKQELLRRAEELSRQRQEAYRQRQE